VYPPPDSRVTKYLVISYTERKRPTRATETFPHIWLNVQKDCPKQRPNRSPPQSCVWKDGKDFLPAQPHLPNSTTRSNAICQVCCMFVQSRFGKCLLRLEANEFLIDWNWIWRRLIAANMDRRCVIRLSWSLALITATAIVTPIRTRKTSKQNSI
jgi:hypothetical protein